MANAAATPTYPGDRNNDPKSNNWPFRDLSLINQNAGGVEFVNTKDDEQISLYHKNGSYMRFHKLANDYLHTLDKREHVQGDSRIEVNGRVVEIFHKDVETIQLGDSYHKIGDIDKWQSFFEQYKNLVRPIHDKKRLFELQRTQNYNSIDQSPLQNQSGTPSECLIEKAQGTFLYTTSPTIYVPGSKAPCDYTLPVIIDLETAYNEVTNDTPFCFTCGGTHINQSSQDGTWTVDPIKKTITQDRVDIQKQLFEIEKHLGQNKHREGGSKIEKIAKDYVGIVGLTFNDFESFRKDPLGKSVPCAFKIEPLGKFINIQHRPSTLIEHVHVDRMPGGSYDLTICDGYNLVVGSNGINMKTTGPLELYSPIINIAGEQLTFGTRGEIGFDAQRFDVNAEIITLRPKRVEAKTYGNVPLIDEQQVMVDGNLQVGMNTIIRGGLHVEGELSIQHITAPMEEQITDESFEWGEQANCLLDPDNGGDCLEPIKSSVRGDIVPGCLIGYAMDPDDGPIPVISTCAPNSVIVHNHYHMYKSLPMKLIRDNIEVNQTVGGINQVATLDPNSAVRAVGSRNNFAVPIIAKPVQNSKTNNTVLEKFGGSICSPLVINEGEWEDSNQLDTFPDGDGVRTSRYTDKIISDKITALENLLEQKYLDLLNKIDSLVSNPQK